MSFFVAKKTFLGECNRRRVAPRSCLFGFKCVFLASVRKLSQNDGQSTMAIRDCPTIQHSPPKQNVKFWLDAFWGCSIAAVATAMTELHIRVFGMNRGESRHAIHS
jgi:hypothetical protein